VRKSPFFQFFFIVFICGRESPEIFYIVLFEGANRYNFEYCFYIAADIVLLFGIKGANRQRFIIVFFVNTIRAFFTISFLVCANRRRCVFCTCMNHRIFYNGLFLCVNYQIILYRHRYSGWPAKHLQIVSLYYLLLYYNIC